MTGVVAGVDGCPMGWAVVFRRPDGSQEPVFAVVETFAAILDHPLRPEIIAVDMPIGLPERIGRSGRGPEQAVRPHLGERQSSVFAVPSRAAVMEADYRRSCAVAQATSDPPKKVSKQCFNLFPKIREIDALMTRALEARVYECHPELGFWRLNGERAMRLPKKAKSRVNPAGHPTARFEEARWADQAPNRVPAASAMLCARGQRAGAIRGRDPSGSTRRGLRRPIPRRPNRPIHQRPRLPIPRQPSRNRCLLRPSRRIRLRSLRLRHLRLRSLRLRPRPLPLLRSHRPRRRPCPRRLLRQAPASRVAGSASASPSSWPRS